MRGAPSNRAMSLRRPNPRFAQPDPVLTPEEQRLQMLESSVRSLRPSRAPSEPPVPIPSDRSNRMVLVLAEMALRQIALGDGDEARRTLGDAIVVLDEVTDDRVIAQASILVGEGLLAVDRPHLAEPRFQKGLAIAERYGERGWMARASIGLGRSLILLDDPMGCEVLVAAKKLTNGEKALNAQIDAQLEYAKKLFDTPRSVHTGYGRPVTIPPQRG